ncbi:MAG: hypothetical protein ABI954_03655 [Pyrinomonadaceae bacterium]
MDTKPRIKVIKRNEQQPKSVVKVVKNKTKTAQSAARDMVATVTEWVTEFQQKRRDETQDALNKFFPQTPNPSGCSNF